MYTEELEDKPRSPSKTFVIVKTLGTLKMCSTLNNNKTQQPITNISGAFLTLRKKQGTTLYLLLKPLIKTHFPTLSDWSDLSSVVKLNWGSHFRLIPSFYSHSNKENKKFSPKIKLSLILFHELLMQMSEGHRNCLTIGVS